MPDLRAVVVEQRSARITEAADRSVERRELRVHLIRHDPNRGIDVVHRDTHAVLTFSGGSPVPEGRSVENLEDFAPGLDIFPPAIPLHIRAEIAYPGHVQATTSKTILMSGGGNIVSHDVKGQLVDRFELRLGAEARADRIDVHGARAYCLVNDVHPAWALALGMSPGGSLMEIARADIGGSNPHLDTQWVDLDEDRWWVVSSTHGAHGGEQRLYDYDLEGHTREGSRPVYSYAHDAAAARLSEVGHPIVAVTSSSPAWCLFEQNDRLILGSEMRGDRRQAGFAPFPLAVTDALPAHVWRKAQLVQFGRSHLLALVGNEVSLIEVIDQPHILDCRDLDFGTGEAAATLLPVTS